MTGSSWTGCFRRLRCRSRPTGASSRGLSAAALRLIPFAVRQPLVVVDRAGADLHLRAPENPSIAHGPNGLGEDATVEGGHDVLHKASVGGGPQHGWRADNFEARVEDSWERNADAVAEAVERAAREHRVDMVMLSGDVRAMGLLREALGRETSERLLEVPGGDRGAALDRGPFREALTRATEEFIAARRPGPRGPLPREPGARRRLGRRRDRGRPGDRPRPGRGAGVRHRRRARRDRGAAAHGPGHRRLGLRPAGGRARDPRGRRRVAPLEGRGHPVQQHRIDVRGPRPRVSCESGRRRPTGKPSPTAGPASRTDGPRRPGPASGLDRSVPDLDIGPLCHSMDVPVISGTTTAPSGDRRRTTEKEEQSCPRHGTRSANASTSTSRTASSTRASPRTRPRRSRPAP
ncbi:Vms1/Ankzf1 family peptidyl-tRNA hydrolase [Brachybacterium sp. GPGPB12]|uniref:baeRF2 domain-containing protein n=1 Tax=Brachybacterium sp. GPGPB12 TaxID=3023517 RepID=UPI0031344B80